MHIYQGPQSGGIDAEVRVNLITVNTAIIVINPAAGSKTGKGGGPAGVNQRPFAK